jgi:acyl-CoA-binding protein
MYIFILLSLVRSFVRSRQNRDRLELYALHKQSVHGDAPSTAPSVAGSDLQKFQAWRSKSGTDSHQAMRLYCQEADRQMRVYGLGTTSTSTTLTPPTNGSKNGESSLTPRAVPMTPHSTPISTTTGTTTTTDPPTLQQQPRGLAAIPLLCAAASESRQAYLRRLAQTPLTSAWWKRQEPLTATPGSMLAIPEQVLISTATMVEHVSLRVQQQQQQSQTQQQPYYQLIPAPVVQSLLWPWHNALLALWMGLILVTTACQAVSELVVTIVLGSVRSGHTLSSIWQSTMVPTAAAIRQLTQHAAPPVTARLVGLVLWPAAMALDGGTTTQPHYYLTRSVVLCAGLGVTWWYWCLVLPVATVWLLVAATLAGWCCALIEWAGA